MQDLVGRTFSEVTSTSDTISLKCADGIFTFYHEQDCCENVEIESIVGDLQDLVGEPILLAEESAGSTPSGYEFAYEPESFKWTFYKFATRKGYVDVRWLGTSSGYYSESVSLGYTPVGS
jgi:hypothetical protein